MIYQPSKYHSNTFTHFLQLHSSIANNHTNINSTPANLNARSLELENGKLELHDQNSSSNTSLVNESVGKNFTIAAILGLKKNSQLGLTNRHGEIDDPVPSLNDYNNEFSSIINLTTHSKLFQKFENENRHNFMQQHQQSTNDHPQMQIDQCMYENNNTSNSSYQEHLHKQLNQEFNQHNNNYNRNSVDPANNATNSTLRNHLQQQQQQQQHQQQHPNTNLMNKSLNRERNRLGSKSTTSVTLKNKRVRTIFTPEQLERLEAEFERQQYMVGPERLYLAHTLQLTEAQVKVWFQNRRIKWRKHHLEITQQHLAIARQRQIPMATTSSRNIQPQESPHCSESVVSDGDD
ncbi:unnamed protein product [Diamesa serratosioi]